MKPNLLMLVVVVTEKHYFLVEYNVVSIRDEEVRDELYISGHCGLHPPDNDI